MNTKLIKIMTLTLAVLFSNASMASEFVTSDSRVFSHNTSRGGSGVDPVPLVAPKATQGKCAVFKSAKVQYIKRHYGSANIKTPKLRCNAKKGRCKLNVEWKHSPAGSIKYKVKVTWALGACS